jgi:nitrogen-specific signal transduction histidine kinase/CheY-like chemotaxis protein
LEQRVNEEIAQRMAAEAAFQQAQKMEAIGQLTGGIAHDFNNLLTVVIGSIDNVARKAKEKDEDLHRRARMALEAANRATALTHRLLAFARRQPLEPRPTDINRLVSGMSELLRRTIGEHIAIENVQAGGLWWVSVDPNQMESTLLNLAVNARDAMPNGGKLTIETANTFLDEAYAVTHEDVKPGQYTMVAVTDTGAGMTPEILKRAFEPFFTTKEIGQGTGLGLSQVYGFVKQSGGHVKIYSELGSGTTVKIYLPLLREEEIPALSPARATEIYASPSGEVVLVVEDEPGVRAYSAEVLSELGYRVLQAQDGPEALRLLDRHKEVQLLFTDVGLPGGFTGKQLADEACKRLPHLKVLFTTGYARNAIVHQGRLDPGVELIVKPFTYAALAAKVANVLGKTAVG